MIDKIIKNAVQFNWRKKSTREVIGITSLEKKIKKWTGYYAVTKPARTVYNTKKKIKSKAGLYSTEYRLISGKFPKLKKLWD